ARQVPARRHPAGAAGHAADRGHLRHRRERDHQRLGQGPRHRERAADQDRGRLGPEAGGGRADDQGGRGARRRGAPPARARGRRGRGRGGEDALMTQPTKAELEERLAALGAERDEYLNDLKRVAADFDNYRKRAARDQESLVARAHERLVKELLPVLDGLERTLAAAEEHEEAKLEEGVRLVHQELKSALDREGLAEIETNGRFDPHVHEALLSQPSEAEEGSVLEVVQKGYRLGDRVVRPARVVVAAPAEADGER